MFKKSRILGLVNLGIFIFLKKEWWFVMQVRRAVEVSVFWDIESRIKKKIYTKKKEHIYKVKVTAVIKKKMS